MADRRRDSDEPSRNHVVSEIAPPSGVSPAEYARRLQAAHNYFFANSSGKLDYGLKPLNGYTYNSNSYAVGLVLATGGQFVSDFSRTQYPGSNRPVPARYFGH